MSAQSVESVLSKAMSDAKFADALFADPEKALAGYDLTAEEFAKFKGLTRADFEIYAKATPEERKSLAAPDNNGWGNHNQSALNIYH